MSIYVFIDARAGDIDSILASVAPGAIAVLLDPLHDGLAQIAGTLVVARDVQAIHIVSHGAQGKLYLGNSVITGETLANHGSALATIGDSLSAQGDILLYGCEVAGGAAGQPFIQQLAAYTRADVAASINNTGSAARNGDWVLEATTGLIEAQTLAPVTYDGLLATPFTTRAGTLDQRFDGDGKVRTIDNNAVERIYSLALQADGKIVAGGERINGTDSVFALARYNTDGTLDTVFDGDGKLTTAFGTTDFPTYIHSLALQADGKIVAGGIGRDNGSSVFALARYNTDGTLDTTLDGDGKLTTAFGTTGPIIDIVSLALQADAKIVAVGQSFDSATRVSVLVRYNIDGTLDTAFDGDGKVTTAFFVNSLALQTDGKIVVGGADRVSGSAFGFALARYNTDGTLDTAFDGDGKVTTAFGSGSAINTGINSLALQADGKIVVGGSSTNSSGTTVFSLARYNTDGTLDTAFDGDGTVTTTIGTNSRIRNLALQADGKIVVSGFDLFNDSSVMARYNTDGSLDISFDGDGIATLPTDISFYGLALQADGMVVAGGYTNFRSPDTTDFALIRIAGASSIADKTSVLGAAVNHIVVFTDPEGGPVTYSATLATGAPLPTWLALQSSTGEFSGLPTQGDVGRYDISVTATDTHGAAGRDGFSLAITNLAGSSGDDTLYGGLGADTMTGLAGNDVYIVDHAADRATEAVDSGTDLVRASVTYTLEANVENLVLTGSGNISGTGNGADNTLTGNSGANSLRGGAGNDVIAGGLGLDVAIYSGLPSAYTITRNGLTTTVTGPDGTDTLTGAERLQFAGGKIRALEHAERDFGDDGKSDVLWRNDNGYVLHWNMNGATILSNPWLGAITTDWKIADGAGDYNGDGKSDLLWRNDNGSVVTWLMDGDQIASVAFISSISNDWKIADGAGDYNGDGKSDLLWRNDNGLVVTWLMDGNQITSVTSFSFFSNDWKIADGSGDYNGDGRSDLLWRNDDGNVALWLMNSNVFFFSTTVVGLAGLEWKIADGSGDYNGDGKSDILWRNDNGNLLMWQMNGTAATFSTPAAAVLNDWKIADGSSDYNGDGKSDLLWINDNGAVLTWSMDGAMITSAAAVTSVPAEWHIQS